MADENPLKPENIKFMDDGKIEINFKGNFDFSGLYKLLYYWFAENGYKDAYGGNNIEDYYMEMKLPGTALTNHWIWWRLQKKEDKFTTNLNIDFQTLAAGEKEVLVHNQKHKVMSGEIKVMILVTATFDNSDWASNSILKGLYYRLRPKQYETIIGAFKDEMYEEVFEIADRIKMAFGMFQTFPLDRQITEPNAYPQFTR